MSSRSHASDWELIERTKFAAVRVSRRWSSHGGLAWRVVEIENLGECELGIDFRPDKDAAWLDVRESPQISRILQVPSDRDLALAQLRFAEHATLVRLPARGRWCFDSTWVERASLEAAWSRGQLRVSLWGFIVLVTEAGVEAFEFGGFPPSLDGLEFVDSGPRTVFERRPDHRPEWMSEELGSGEPEVEPTAELVTVVPLTLRIDGFARDEAVVPAIHEPILRELGRALDRLPRGVFNVSVRGRRSGAQWPSSGWEALAMARARAVAEQLELEKPPSLATDAHSDDRRVVEVALWSAGPRACRGIDLDDDTLVVGPSALLVAMRRHPELAAVLGDGELDVTRLRALVGTRQEKAVWLLAPDRVRSAVGQRGR